MENDDKQVGRILGRREVLALLGRTSALAGVVTLAGRGGLTAAWPAAAAPPQAGMDAADVPCVVSPAQTEGPYFIDERLNRSDICSDPAGGAVKPGTPLRLTLRALRVTSNGCIPLAGATVDIWHCDALGQYSDERASGTVGQKFLRGYQTTDANGVVRFTTIYPGWYPGRAVHIHFKVRAADANAASRGYEFTSQLYFDDAVTDQVYAQAPYADRARRSLRNRDDGIFRRSGRQLTLAVKEDGRGGYAATFDIGLRVA